ncbi:MAG: hypothetical protein ABJ004_19445 [Cyclobacteriaceae bacterium]
MKSYQILTIVMFIAGFLFLSHNAVSQTMKVHLRSDDKEEFVDDKFQGFGENTLNGLKQAYKFHEIEAVIFYDEPKDGVVEYLLGSGVKIVDRYSQKQKATVNGIPLSEINVEYVQIVGTAKFLSSKVTIQIDFGQEDKFFSGVDTQILDGNGRLLTLNSMIDALNFMSKNGYDYVDAYVITVGNQNVYHYLLKKRETAEK